MSSCCSACAEASIAGVDGGVCDGDFHVVSSDAIFGLKDRIALQVEALNLTVASCAQLSEQERQAWALYYNATKAFAAARPFLPSGSDFSEACAWARTVDAWKVKIESVCKSPVGPGPIVPPASGDVKWVSAAVIAVALVVGGLYVARKVL